MAFLGIQKKKGEFCMHLVQYCALIKDPLWFVFFKFLSFLTASVIIWILAGKNFCLVFLNSIKSNNNWGMILSCSISAVVLICSVSVALCLVVLPLLCCSYRWSCCVDMIATPALQQWCCSVLVFWQQVEEVVFQWWHCGMDIMVVGLWLEDCPANTCSHFCVKRMKYLLTKNSSKQA